MRGRLIIFATLAGLTAYAIHRACQHSRNECPDSDDTFDPYMAQVCGGGSHSLPLAATAPASVNSSAGRGLLEDDGDLTLYASGAGYFSLRDGLIVAVPVGVNLPHDGDDQ